MPDDLLSYYNRELSYLRKLGAEFAELHPKVAGRLRMSGDVVEDPHVSRLLEGAAFLNARIRHKLDDEFPELTNGLIGHLYPHYLAPVPSMAIVQMRPAPDLTEARQVTKGTEMVSEAVAGERCRFRTTQPVTVLPIDIEAAALSGRPLIGPVSPKGCVGVLRLTLKCTNKDASFAKLAPDSLRFYLRAPQAEAQQLYELILNNTGAVAIAESLNDPRPLVLDASAIRQVGFDTEEAMIPYPARSALGYRLLTEYFAFPEKFLFFDVAGIAPKLRGMTGKTLEIFIYVNRSALELELGASKESFALGCTPVINLFQQRAEPIPVTGVAAEYQVVPDSRRPGGLEVYSIDKVSVSAPDGAVREVRPIYGLTHAGSVRKESWFWHATRRDNQFGDAANESYISFVDLDGDPAQAADWVASVETTCTNRELAGKLPFGGGHPQMRLVREQTGVGGIACLTAPTVPLRLRNRKESVWRLVSHLVLNHLSLAEQTSGPEALREILHLYDFRGAPETRAMIDSLVGVEAQRSTARAPNRAMGVLCRGLDVTLQFDEQPTSGAGVYLLAAVLERFLAHYVSINTFTRLTAKVKGRAGVLRTWPPRAGDLTLL
ncbi:MAG TPA: type VI secretion system baseplate subunit TssF [Caulobacteraceae bacterium]